MIQRCLPLALTILTFGNLSAVFAQVDPKKDPTPKIDRLEAELIEQMRRILEEARMQPLEQQKRMMRQFAPAGNPRWGGLQFKNADKELRENLGLPDNEGIVVLAIDANSPAEKAGLKVNDVIVKINDKSAPSDPVNFADLVKQQKPNEAMEIVVVRDGKEETLKAVQMPQTVQEAPLGGRGLQAFGGPKRLQQNPFGGPLNRGVNGAQNYQIEFNVGGVRMSRKKVGDDFSGEYATDSLKISLIGKIDKGRPKVTEVTVREGKNTKTYTDARDVPPQHLSIIMTLTPPAIVAPRDDN